MKHYSLLTVIAAMLFLLATSCGKKEKSQDDKESIQLKPATTEISGEMEGCFTVVDRNYKVKFESFTGGILTVELVRTDKPLPFSTDDRELYSFSSYSASPYVQVGFGIELLDEDGNIIDKVSASGSGLSGSYSPDECVELVKLSEGKTGSIRFSISDGAKEATSFRITSAFEYGGSNNASVDEVYTINEDSKSSDDSYVEVIDIDDNDDYTSDQPTTGSKGSQNWDTLLDSYERFADRYAEFYKKVKDGTITITSPEYAEYMQEAADFAEKAQNAKGSMNAKQLARYNKITMKLASAIN